MRILMTADTVGGVWTYTRELAAGLLAAGCDITLITLGRAPSEEQQAWIDGTGCRWPGSFRALTTEFKLEWMQENADVYSSSAGFLLDCVREFTPDLIHSSQFCYGALPVPIPKLVVAHSDVLSWWRCSRETEPESSEWLANYRRLVCRGLAEADMLIAPSQWMLEQIISSYGDLLPAAVIPNGRDVSLMHAGHRNLQAVTAGRLWDEGKNIQILGHVSAPMPLMIAGERVFEGAQATLLNRPGICQLGHLSDHALLRLLCESAIYIVPSRYEPFGLAAVEAALAGCAIVANDIPSLREVWGDTALYYQRNDPGSLSELLHRLACDPFTLRDYTLRAVKRARRCYSRERMTSAYLSLYRQLIDQEATVHAA